MKRGEAIAARELPDDVKTSITPLLLAQQVTGDDAPTEVQKRVDAALRTWPAGGEAWVDVRPLVTAGSEDPETLLAAAGAGAGSARVVPVIGLDRGQAADWPDDDLLVLTLQPDDAMTLLGGGPIVHDILTARHLNPDRVHVVIDLGAAPNATRAEAMLRGLAPLGPWRSVTVAAGSFTRPSSAGLHRLAREDWTEWLALARSTHADAAGPLRFGDYGVLEAEWEPPDAPIAAIDMAPRIAYTSHAATLVARGRSVRRFGWEQVQDLARQLVAEPEWAGEAFSAGDAQIARWGLGGTTNAEDTVKAGTSHHLTHVSRQLATHPWT